MIYLLAAAFALAVTTLIIFVRSMKRYNDAYVKIAEKCLDQVRETNEQIIKLALSKSTADYEYKAPVESVTDDLEKQTDEVVLEGADDKLFNKMIEKQLNPEVEEEVNG